MRLMRINAGGKMRFGGEGDVKQEDKIKAQADTLRFESVHREESRESTHAHTHTRRGIEMLTKYFSRWRLPVWVVLEEDAKITLLGETDACKAKLGASEWLSLLASSELTFKWMPANMHMNMISRSDPFFLICAGLWTRSTAGWRRLRALFYVKYIDFFFFHLLGTEIEKKKKRGLDKWWNVFLIAQTKRKICPFTKLKERGRKEKKHVRKTRVKGTRTVRYKREPSATPEYFQGARFRVSEVQGSKTMKAEF